MVADIIVICSESREQVEEKREVEALQRTGTKLQQNARVNDRDPSGVVRLQGVEIKKLEALRLKSKKEQGKEVKRHMPTG